MSLKDIKKEFPIFNNKIQNNDLVYLDSANSSQKPKSVIEKLSQFYSYEFANVGRGIYQLASNASEKYEETRDELKKFINKEKNKQLNTFSIIYFKRLKKKEVKKLNINPSQSTGKTLLKSQY